MSTLRKIANLQREEHDPAKAVTVSLPASLIARIDGVIHETGLGRSAVVQSLLKDALVDYMNEPLQKALSEARDALEQVSLMDVPECVDRSFEEDYRGGQMAPADLIAHLQQTMEFNRKAVWG